MPKHITRLILLMVVFGAVAYAAKIFFTPASFYSFGHYRGDSVVEIASDKPKYKGSDYCQGCHFEIYATWFKGLHHAAGKTRGVQCEVCHDAAGGRDQGGLFQHVSTGSDHPASGKLPVPRDSLKLCPICHEKVPGRPEQQRQVDVATHSGTQQCTACHNAHSPKIVLAAIPEGKAGAPGAGKAPACAGCHGNNGVSTNPVWPNLAAQQAVYFVEALKAYKTGARDNVMMSAAAKALSDADMRTLAQYYAGLKVGTANQNAVGQDLAAAKAKASACAACHGATGVSSNPAWPSLAGQQKSYLAATLKAYRDGTRKNEMMAGIAKTMSDADIDALAAYYSTASPK